MISNTKLKEIKHWKLNKMGSCFSIKSMQARSKKQMFHFVWLYI